MKIKHILLTISAILLLCLVTSCDSVYSESWFSTKGYVERDASGDFVRFVKGATGKPDGTPIAYRWDHRYVSTPRCTLTPKKWDDEEIEYTEYARATTFEIRSTPREINGLIFWCDEENVYVVNDKYDKYVDKESYMRDEWDFNIDISGIRDLDFYMCKKNGSGDW